MSPQGREIPRRHLHSRPGERQAHTEAGQRLWETERGEDGRGRLPLCLSSLPVCVRRFRQLAENLGLNE